MRFPFFTRFFSGLKKTFSTATPLIDETATLQAAHASISRDDFPAALVDFELLVNTGSKKPDVYVSYGYVLLSLGRHSQAKTALQTALTLAPDNADAYYMLGKACVKLDDPGTAEKAWATCYAFTQKIEALYCDYCLLLVSRQKIDEAKKLMLSGVKNYADNADMYLYLGNLYSELQDYENAVIAYRQSMALDPDPEQLLSNYSIALRQTGNLALSLELAKRAVDINPSAAHMLSNYLLSIQYSSVITKEEKFAAHLEYAQKFETPVSSHWGNYSNSLALDRKIRLGYVSGDFRSHSMIFFILPILANHDKSKFEVYGYYNYPHSDADTMRVKQLCDVWIACHDMSDDALEMRIRADEVDILIDLSGHTGHNRLQTFARKPAPVQMTWLGYQSTTGLSAIDYRITEEALDPTGITDAFHSEKLLRLPSSGTFSPLPGSPPVNELPALCGSAFTFACLNNPSKITDEAIALWSQILTAAPKSRLMIGYATPTLVEKLSLKFASNNVDISRIVFQPKVDLMAYLQLHHQVDLALDTCPYNGGTTTFHCLWMGVPILALEGDTAVSKVGAGIMRGLGLSQFCCVSAQNYVNRAVYFSDQLAELNAVRLSLRQQMDVAMQWLAKQVTLSLETSLEDIWHAYIQKTMHDQQMTSGERQVSK